MTNRTIAMALLAATAALACGGEPGADRESGAAGDSLAQTASSYTLGTDSMGVDGTPTGDMLGAPALIEPVRLELQRMVESPRDWAQANLTAHKFLLADLVAAMESDLRRLGVSDTDDLSALGDTIATTLGGGTGLAEGPEPDAVPEHVERVERLIALYQAKLAAAR